MNRQFRFNDFMVVMLGALALGGCSDDEDGETGGGGDASSLCQEAVQKMCDLSSSCMGNVGDGSNCSSSCSAFMSGNCNANTQSAAYWQTCLADLDADEAAGVVCSQAAFISDHYAIPDSCSVPNSGMCIEQP
ncbi:MAG: hypothetical protein AAGN82_14725 [Myxococcota bacterium]